MKSLFKLILVFLIILGWTNEGNAQTYTMSNGTVTTCGGTFYDPGGTGNYGNNDGPFTMTFCSSGGGPISLDFTVGGFQVETSYDFLDIYDGTTTTGTPIYQSVSSGGTTNPGIITSTTGCLTITWDSDGSVTYQGWQAAISCPSCTDGIQNGNETGVDCGGSDCPACPNCYNGIQDGNETGVDCGGSCPEACHCSDGIQNFDETGVDCGGADCYPCPEPCEITATWEVDGTGSTTFPGGPAYNMSSGTVSTCGGTFYDPSGTSNYGNNQLNTMTFCSDNPDPNSQIVFDFTTWSLETCCDYLTIYDGPTASGTQLFYGNGSSNPGTVMSSNGCLTFVWDSDGSVTYAGWVANIGCYVPATLDCNGGNVVLTANGQGSFTYVLNNDFDQGNAGSGWNTNITADFSNPCDPSIDGGTYMWMGNSAPHPRIIETTNMDVSCGGTICFFLDFATQGNASPCEGIDLANEGVYFDYSIDGGATWVTIEYFGPAGVGNSTNSGGTDPQMTSWNNYCFDIPPGAMTPTTLFRWAQTGSSGLNNDHWGIDNVTIQSLVDCSPYYYDWSQVPGSPDNATQNETVTGTTTYTVTYTNGTTDACSTTVTVPVPPGTTANAGPDVTMCEGDPAVTIGGNPVTPDDGATYTWDNGAGSGTVVLTGGSQDNGQSTVAPASTTTYTLSVTYNGCTSTDDVTVTVNPLPIVDAGPDVSICDGQSTTLTASGAATYAWSPATGLSGTGTASVTANPTSTTTYTVTGTSAAGCINTDQVTVTVTPLPDPSFTLTNFCVGGANSATITGTTGGTFSFNPAPGDGATIDPVSGAISNGVSGTTYTVQYSVGVACPQTSTQTVTVNPLPVLDVPDFTFCSGAAMTVNESGAGDPAWTYSWTSNGSASFANSSAQTSGITGAVDGEVFTVTVTDANGCTNTDIATLTISGNAPINAGPDVTICDGASTTLTATGGVSYTWDDGTGAPGAGNGISVSPSTTTTYTVVGQDAAGCFGTDQMVVTVNPIPTVDPVTPQTLCANATTTTVTFTGTVAGTTYDWTNDNTSIGLGASGTGDIASFTATNTGATSVTATITVTPTANGCTGTPITFTITVDPIPTVDPITDQTLCANTATSAVNFTGAVAGTTYDWTNDNTATGLGASGTGNIASFTGTNTGSVSEVSTVTVTPTAAGCVGTPESFTITVDPIPTVDPVADQVLCNNPVTADVNFTGAVAGTTYDWTNNNTTIGLAATGSGDILSFTATNTGSTTEVATVTVTPTANGCVGTPITFTYTVYPIPNVDPFTDQVLCAGDPTTAVVPTGAVAGTTFDWTNDNTNIGLGASGTGNIATFSPTAGTTVEVATITYTPTANGCTGAPESFTITVNPIPTVDPVADQTLCNNPVTTDVIFTGAVAGTTYDWTNDNTSIGLAASGTGDILSFTAVNTGSTTEVATITVTPTINGCVGTPITFTYTVFPIPTVDPFIDQVLCAGDPTSAVIPTGAVTGTTYNWTNDNTNIGLGASGTGNIASFAGTATTTTEVATITYTPTANGCTGAPESFTITVNPIPTVDPVADQVLCNNPTTTDVIFTGAVAGTTFDWTNDNTSIGLAASGTGDILSFTAVNTGSTTQVATITVTPSLNGCIGTPITYTYTVYPIPTVDPFTDQVLCAGDPTTAVIPTGAVTGTTYNWTNDNTAIGLAASGTGNIATFSASATTTTEVATITYTPTANGCTGAPESFTITVNPIPTVDPIADQTLCHNSSTTDINFTGAVTGTSYDWTNDNTSIGLVASGTGDILSFSATNTGSTTAVATITVTPSSNGCTGTPISFTITVNPIPNVDPIADQTLCEGQATAGINFTGFVTGTTYSWFNDNTATGLGASGTGNIASFTAVNTSPTAVVSTVTVTPSANGCTGTPETFTITVNPLPTATISGTVAICEGDPDPTVTITGTEGVAPYTFTYNINGGATQSISSDLAGIATITVPATPAGTYSYNLLSVTDASGTACTQTQSGTATVTVNPNPTPVIVGPTDYCTGTFATLTTSQPYASYNWSTGATTASVDVTAADNPITVTVTNAAGCTTTSPVFTVTENAVITYNATIEICDGESATIHGSIETIAGVYSQTYTTPSGCDSTANITLVVNPLPPVDAGVDQEVCNGTQITLVATGAQSYVWDTGINNGVQFTPALGTTIHTVTGTDANGCVNTDQVTVIVNPLPTATIAGTNTICVGDGAQTITFTGANGTAPYTFTYTLNGGGPQTIVSTGNTATINVPDVTAGTWSYDLQSVSDATATACSQAQAGNATIIINPLPTATIAGTSSICVGDGAQTITFTGANGTSPYTFSYTLNGGAPQTIVSTGNTATITVSDAVAGTSSYDLIGVQDASSTACYQAQTGNATVIVNPLPTATITGTIDICEGDTDPVVTFTGANGTAPYTFTYNINGAGNQTIVSNGAGVATIVVSSATPGTFAYNLVSVVDASSTACSQAQAGTATVIINPMPTATISGTAMVCEGSIDQIVTFTGANGTSPYTFTYTLNGGAPQTIVSTGNTATITIPGTSVGVFSYDLVSVQDASSTTCAQPQTGNATVTINPGPTASIAGTIDVCEGDTDPIVTITGANGTEPYTFTYTLNNGATQTLVSTGPTATITVSTATPGTYSYELTSVTDASATACTQVLAENATVIVNPMPTATIAGTNSICVGDGSQTITFTGANGTAPYTFTYTLNGGANQTIVSTGNTATITVSDATAGTFSYDLVSVQDASSTTCGQPQAGNATVVVNPLPTATIAGTVTLCVGDPSATITFTGANGTAPYTFTYNVNNGPNQTITSTGNTATITVPTTTAGVTNYNLVSVQDASTTSCSQAQPGTATVTVNPLPTATIAGDVIVCVNDAQPTITFTGANGTAPYTFTYTLNGGANQTVTSVGNTATVLAPTTTAGTFTYALVSVQDASTTACSQAQTGTATVIVNPLPTATIAGTIDVCENDAQPSITFTGANGTAPYTFTYSLNGQPSLTVTSTGNVATVQVPTSVPGSFTYTLQSVQDASTTGCSQFQTGTATVVVNPLPTATIAGDVNLCVGAAQPSITFTGASGTAPYTFTYTLNGGAPQTITSTGNTATVFAPTTTAGSFVYSLVSVQDASSTSCSQAQTGTATVNVNPLPTATITGDAEVCLGAASPVITFTGAGATAPYTFEYTINNGPVQTITSSGGNSATVLASTSNTGTFTYDLISVTDGSATGCSQAQSGTATVLVNPLPTATIAGDAQVCLNGPDQTITFTGANGTAPYTFTYTVNGGPNQTITSTGNTATITVPAAAVGVTTFSLVGVEDASSTHCFQTQTGLASVEVVGLPPIYAGVDFSVCQGDEIVLTASGGTGYVWNGGAVQNGVPFIANVTDTFVVIGVNPTGCMNTDTLVVTVHPLPVPSFTADTTMGCAPLEVTFTNTTPGQLTNCIWTLSNGAILNGCGSVSYTFTQGGTYDVTLQTTTTDGCTAQETYQYYIYVEQPAIADFSPSSSIVSTLDSEVEFINQSQNASSYWWTFGDGSAFSDEENPTHVFPNEEFGTYGVTLIASTPLGCNDTAYVVIRVEEEIIFYVPNTFTPDQDDYNPIFQPVFTSGYDPFDYTLLIFNRWGEVVFESHNVEIGWDGTYGVGDNKVEVQDGTYTWTIEFKTVNSDERMYVNGHVNVLR